MRTNQVTSAPKLTHTDPYCATCGRPADAHSDSGRCPEVAAGLFATYTRSK